LNDDGELVCPSCGTRHPDSERFCERCGMPLVHAGGGELEAPSDRRRRARKIKPQYAEGRVVKVARASSQAEAEFIAGLLLEEGIPSIVQRAPGADVAEFLAAGPRDVLVPESGAQAAREALAWERPPADEDATRPG
jgi:Putative prokaryotic signal transducing protein/zinc-ribbon domain